MQRSKKLRKWFVMREETTFWKKISNKFTTIVILVVGEIMTSVEFKLKEEKFVWEELWEQSERWMENYLKNIKKYDFESSFCDLL